MAPADSHVFTKSWRLAHDSQHPVSAGTVLCRRSSPGLRSLQHVRIAVVPRRCRRFWTRQPRCAPYRERLAHQVWRNTQSLYSVMVSLTCPWFMINELIAVHCWDSGINQFTTICFFLQYPHRPSLHPPTPTFVDPAHTPISRQITRS